MEAVNGMHIKMIGFLFVVSVFVYIIISIVGVPEMKMSYERERFDMLFLTFRE